MENPGEYLKREREQREVPLSKIAESTRVPLKSLEALEADDFDSLPHPAFVKGYIKSYCKFLGLDETDAVLRYELFLREKSDRTEEEKAGEAKKKQFNRFTPSRISEGSTASSPFSAGYIVTAAVVLAAVAVIYYYTSSTKNTAPPPEQAPVPAESAAAPQASATEAASPQAAPANGQASAKPADGPARGAEEAASARAAGEKHSLTVSATEMSWVKVVIDDEEPFDVVLRAGEKVSWKASRAFHIVVGNAGGVALNFDGEELGGLGASGEVVKLTLPKGAAVPKAKKPVIPAPKAPAATIAPAIAPAAGISATTAAAPKPAVKKPAVKKPAQTVPPTLDTGAGMNGTAGDRPEDAGDAVVPKWDSTPQKKFKIVPPEETVE